MPGLNPRGQAFLYELVLERNVEPSETAMDLFTSTDRPHDDVWKDARIALLRLKRKAPSLRKLQVPVWSS